jgi:hypothetical protein
VLWAAKQLSVLTCRSAFRHWHKSGERANDLGFRVVLLVSPPAGVRTESGAKDKPSSPAIAPFTDAEAQRIAALPAAEQLEEVRKELMRRNPGFDGKLEMETKIEGGVVTEFKIVTDKVTDIAPIRVWSALRLLKCRGTTTKNRPNGQLEDLTPLEGMNLAGLRYLDLTNTKMGDSGLAPFKDCKNLTELGIPGTQVGDAGLAHLKDCKTLTNIDLAWTKVSDAGMVHLKDCTSLKVLQLSWTQVGDACLAHLKACENLTYLNLAGTKVSDTGLAHIKGCIPSPKENRLNTWDDA